MKLKQHIFSIRISHGKQIKSAVGRMSLDRWTEFIDPIKELYKNHPEGEIQGILESYNGKNLSEAAFNLVHALFKEYGLVILDADNAELKTQMRFVVEGELKEQKSFKAIQKSNESLEKLGYGAQAFAREINFFHLDR